MILEGRVLVNGRVVKPGYEMRSGDSVSISFPPPEIANELAPVAMSLEILHEDQDIVVINKASGVVVHPGTGGEEGTLVHGLLSHCPRLAPQGAPQRPGIVHRLDRDTSGVMVVAKSGRAYLNLIEQFKDHKVLKEYLALVYGKFSRADGEIRTCLGRNPADRKKMAVLHGKGREAISRWHVEREWGEVTLVRVSIETGRTHQIRVHFSHLHHPVVGDATYGGGKRRARLLKSKTVQDLLLQVDRQLLHAWRLAFTHPVTGVGMNLTAPIPLDFARVLERLDDLHPAEGPRDAFA